MADKFACILRRHAGLLRFFAGVYLNEEFGRAAPSRNFRSQRLGEFWAVERMDRIEQLQRFADLVALQRPDKMKFDIGKTLTQLRPFGLGFLHAILAENAMTGFQHRKNSVGLMRFGDGHQNCFRRRRYRRLSCRVNPGKYGLKIGSRSAVDFNIGGHILASHLARAKLARAARRLNRAAAHIRLPALILMTDEARVPDPMRALLALPKGAALILRHRDVRERARLAIELAPVAKRRSVLFLIAGDPLLAARVGADGIHVPEARMVDGARWRIRQKHWLITAATHSERALLRARIAGAHAAIFAPVFRSASHPDNPGFGILRFLLTVRRARIPVFALGGISAANVERLGRAHLVGLAAIEALLPD